jgi:hypothetical protein
LTGVRVRLRRSVDVKSFLGALALRHPACVVEAAADGFYQDLEALGVAQRFTHRMDSDTQWKYNDWLAGACGPDVAPLPAWRRLMHLATGVT